MTIERTAVNPVPWSLELGFNQGELVSGHTRTLYCSGQTAMDADGKPQHDGDLPAQLALSLDNLESVLTEAGMSLANLVRLNVYTTDVDLLFPHYGVLAARLGAAGVAPATTMLGVTGRRSTAGWSSSRAPPSREATCRSGRPRALLLLRRPGEDDGFARLAEIRCLVGDRRFFGVPQRCPGQAGLDHPEVAEQFADLLPRPLDDRVARP